MVFIFVSLPLHTHTHTHAVLGAAALVVPHPSVKLVRPGAHPKTSAFPKEIMK